MLGRPPLGDVQVELEIQAAAEGRLDYGDPLVLALHVQPLQAGDQLRQLVRVGERAEDPLGRSLEMPRAADAHARYANHMAAPRVLFVCVHNAGRSQMAAALLERHAAGRVDVVSAGSEPADELNPAVVEAMLEVGIALDGRRPRRLEDEDVREADVVVTMGCGDACPVYPGKRYEDWALDDPAGKTVDEVRPIRDEIDRRVHALLSELEG